MRRLRGLGERMRYAARPINRLTTSAASVNATILAMADFDTLVALTLALPSVFLGTGTGSGSSASNVAGGSDGTMVLAGGSVSFGGRGAGIGAGALIGIGWLPASRRDLRVIDRHITSTTEHRTSPLMIAHCFLFIACSPIRLDNHRLQPGTSPRHEAGITTARDEMSLFCLKLTPDELTRVWWDSSGIVGIPEA